MATAEFKGSIKDVSKTCSRSRHSSKKKADLLELKNSLNELQEVLDNKEALLRRKVATLEGIAAASSRSSNVTISEASVSRVEIDSVHDEEHARTREWAEKHRKFFSESWETPETAAKPPQSQTDSGSVGKEPSSDRIKDQFSSCRTCCSSTGKNRDGAPKRQNKTSDNEITKLANAIQGIANGSISRDTRLPAFDGSSNDWLLFKATYEETTRKFKISPIDNIARLRLALKGEARAAVSASLYTCSDPGEVMSNLELRFGHPAKIVRDQIRVINNLKPVSNDPVDLSKFSCIVSNCCASISAISEHSEYEHSAQLYETVVLKLNNNLRSRWAEYASRHADRKASRLACLSVFLKQEAECALRYLPVVTTGQAGTSARTPPVPTTAAAGARKYPIHTANAGKPKLCSFCSESDHNIVTCSKFIALDIPDRHQWIKENKKCYRCLLFQHLGKDCKISKYLHRLLRMPKQTENVNLQDESESANINTITQNVSSKLKVIPVKVTGPKGSCHTHALLDEGATISLIDLKLAQEIGAYNANCPTERLTIKGIGSSCQTFRSSRVKVDVEGKTGRQYSINFKTMYNLDLETQCLDKEKILSYSHIKPIEHLIDWYTEATPKLLIGQDYWHLITTRKLYEGEVNEPAVSETLLGHVVHGNGLSVRGSMLCNHISVEPQAPDEELNSLVKQSFSLDSLGVEPKERANPQTERALTILNNTTKRCDDTTWETGLLWEKDDNVFPETRGYALKRLYSLEKSFKKDPIFANAYEAQVQRLLDLNYAQLYDSPEQSVLTGTPKEWVLPHFGVINVNKPGKVRMVCDCASKVCGKCLNDYLLTGPELLQSLLGVLWKFRQRSIGIAADIKDMFLRIKIRPEDQVYQKFYWRTPGSTDPPKMYVMTSMLFGSKCSPSAAIFVKNKNAQEFKDEFPLAVKAIEENHYCDDYLQSFNTEQEAISQAADVITIHSKGNFDICNWASNSTEFLQSIPEDKRARGNIEIGFENMTERTLGLIWQPATDTLSFNLSMKKVQKEVSTGKARPTKRQMLGVVASIFDPIGILTHFTIRGKMLFQEIWQSGISWDEKLKDKEYAKWQQWLTDIQGIKNFSMPRSYAPQPDDASIQLHTFCDASAKAYAAACYLRFAYEDGNVRTALVAAKARVTPLKPCSIPRLELQAAVLGARLAHTVASEHQFPIVKKYFWSDSGTTLAWIRSDPRDYKAFVSHRLAAIDDLTEVSQWKWVPTEFNSADIATRDSKKVEMSHDGPWFSGPVFLKEKEEFWPEEKKKMTPSEEATCEQKEKCINIITKKENYLPQITRFSSWKRLIRATAYMLLFINKCKKTGDGSLTLELLEQAEKLWIKSAQEEDFTQELICLKENKSLPKDSKISSLSPVADEEGILRLKGRIYRVPGVSVEVKRPIILNGSHAYTRLLLHHYHKQHNHASTETVVNEVRQCYWITKMRSSIRSVSHNCQHCKIKRAKALQPPQGNLPLARLEHHKRAFSFCGLDYFGPTEVLIGRRREKRWGALFTCLVTRAVHMEIAGSLTSDSVIMAIRRMSSRRGWPTAIYSDNGTNFKGAETELKKAWSEIDKDAIANDMLARGIEWHYIPANAAHMGGAWERLVQCIKRALAATLNERVPREEVLATLIVEAEHSVNSRPLTFVSVDPNDPEALTPNHFLIGSSSGVPIPGKFDDKDLLLRKQWKMSQRLADMFWSRWIKEYLPTLLDKKMKKTADQDIKVGQPVLIIDYNLPRNAWQRGLIAAIFPGDDGTIRVVEVKTVGGSLRRPVNKIIILPVQQELITSVNCLYDVMSRLCLAQRRDREGESSNSPHCTVDMLPS